MQVPGAANGAGRQRVMTVPVTSAEPITNGDAVSMGPGLLPGDKDSQSTEERQQRKDRGARRPSNGGYIARAKKARLMRQTRPASPSRSEDAIETCSTGPQDSGAGLPAGAKVQPLHDETGKDAVDWRIGADAACCREGGGVLLPCPLYCSIQT